MPQNTEQNQSYVLLRSELENSYSFLPVSGLSTAVLPADAREMWRVEAPDWEVACLRRNQFLGWEPYRPMATSREDLERLLPRHKSDLDRAQLLVNLGYPAVAPVLYEILECVQDANWPIARVLLPFLTSIGAACLEPIRRVLDSDDGMWKYWVIQIVIGQMPVTEAQAFRGDLEKLRASVTADDRDCEVHLAIAELFADFGWQ